MRVSTQDQLHKCPSPSRWSRVGYDSWISPSECRVSGLQGGQKREKATHANDVPRDCPVESWARRALMLPCDQRPANVARSAGSHLELRAESQGLEENKNIVTPEQLRGISLEMAVGTRNRNCSSAITLEVGVSNNP